MTSLYVHYSWFTFLSLFSLLFLIISFYVTFSFSSIYFSFPLFSFWNNDLMFSVTIDFMSSWFATVILFISTIIMVYSYFYMAPYSKSIYFLWMTVLFVLSMLMVVLMSNLFFLMLGWDGLGLVSFFLIVYYQNQSSITSGMFTLLMNRVGDSFFLISIVMLFYTYSDLYVSNSYIVPLSTCVFLMLTFMTKSAIYPFSPWLPLAMAAPTPISALVHSSTLVTSGLYLMMRYSYFLYSYPTLMLKVLLPLSIFTSFMAGAGTVFEKDLKKLIALSTLSHLGVICMAFSVGVMNLAFFHLLTHALFKSLLFMTMGDIMINLNHSQDIRYLSSGMMYTPFSCLIMYVALINLLALPGVSGFYSKDMIIEAMFYPKQAQMLMNMLFFVLVFTNYYSYQLFYYSMSPNKVFPYQNFHHSSLLHSSLLLVLAILALMFGKFYMIIVDPCALSQSVPWYDRVLMWLPNLHMFFILLTDLKLPTIMNKFPTFFYSNMMNLSPIMMNLLSSFYYKSAFMLVKSGEQGVFTYGANRYFFDAFSSLSKTFMNLSMKSPLQMVFLSFFFILVVMFF